MSTAFGKALNVAAGRYWWVLVVRELVPESPLAAQIMRVMRGRCSGHSFVDLSFTGSMEDCRRFQMQNGGADDGVLLVDDVTPVKIVSDEMDSAVDFPGYKENCLDNVKAIGGDYSVVVMRASVESVAQDVQKAGFKLLVHLPSVFAIVESLGVSGEGVRLLSNCENGVARLLLFSGANLLSGFRVLGDSCDSLVKYARERFLLKDAQEETFALDMESIAKAAAEDAWLFRTDGMPAFRIPADRAALKRIREAALFRRVFKVCLVILLLSIVVLSLFWVGVDVYERRSQAMVQALNSRIQKQKDLAMVLDKLERDKAYSEKFLMHRSRVSTSMGLFAAHVPENVWIVRWGLSGGAHSVQGYAVTSEDLSGFLASLEGERSLVNVRLRTTEKTTWKKRQVVRFSLSAEDAR